MQLKRTLSTLNFQKIIESILTAIKRGSFHRSDAVMALNFPGMLLYLRCEVLVMFRYFSENLLKRKEY